MKMKDSLIKNQYLKEIQLWESYSGEYDVSDALFRNEYQFFYKLLFLTRKRERFLRSISKNIYLKKGFEIKVNYFKCFIDNINHLFFNFCEFDFYIFYNPEISIV
jgi:hypothetical protein